jgi:hypothetical protein
MRLKRAASENSTDATGTKKVFLEDRDDFDAFDDPELDALLFDEIDNLDIPGLQHSESSAVARHSKVNPLSSMSKVLCARESKVENETDKTEAHTLPVSSGEHNTEHNSGKKDAIAKRPVIPSGPTPDFEMSALPISRSQDIIWDPSQATEAALDAAFVALGEDERNANYKEPVSEEYWEHMGLGHASDDDSETTERKDIQRSNLEAEMLGEGDDFGSEPNYGYEDYGNYDCDPY